MASPGETGHSGLRRAATETHDFQATARDRANTEPLSLQASRSTLRRTATLKQRKRSMTGENTNPREPYAYTFDDLDDSDDSNDSDSSSSGDEQPPARQRARTAYTDDLSARRRREEARKGHSYSRFHISGDKLKTKGRVSRKDGRLNISIKENANGYVAKALGQRIEHHLNIPRRHTYSARPRYKELKPPQTAAEREAESFAASLRRVRPRPRLNIVIMVIGSRGDIQPFIRVGQILRDDYGHRVRIASHPTFREFVNEAGLEFFSVGGDPAELMSFMVKNPGLIPNLETIREGEIQRRRNAMAVMFDGFWRSCVNATDDEKDRANLKLMGDRAPFVADAIIANPPSMAHVHIAERLGIPLHMMFTFPYSPTQQFPHPLANVMPGKSNVDANYMNFLSYPLVELMTWQGLGQIVNHFRVHTLHLEPVSSLWAPGALYRMHVPYTYLWSPALCPKPKDWGPEIDIAGFVFLDLASNFKPSQELRDFLDAGEPPVYIGFGSIVLDDPDGFTEMIFEAVKMVGCRVLLSQGWGGLKHDNTPDNIFMLGNIPHDWLFPRVKAVVHHGGAGTTAIGLKCAKPTLIVPWFGDQPFWGAMVAEAKAGAHECIPYKKLTAEKLAEGIRQCLTEEAQTNVQKIADSMAKEGDGAENAVVSFHRSLPLTGRASVRCSILEDRPAVWQVRHSAMRLSALAADILHRNGQLAWSDLRLRRHIEWNDLSGAGEPVSGGIEAVKDSMLEIGDGAGMLPIRVARHIRKHEEHERRRKERRKRKEERAQVKAARAELKRQQTNDEQPGLIRQSTNLTTASVQSSVASIPIRRRVLNEFETGIEKAGWALLALPNNFHVAVSRGLHNAPRLYGDATVRTPIRITGFKSGTRAAGQEFVYGLYDGATGVFTQPVWGWREGGSTVYKFVGAGTGMAKGVTGLFLKTINAAVAPPAFFVKGIFKFAEKRSAGPGIKEFLRRARIIQGQRDYMALEAQKDQNGKKRLHDIEVHVLDSWKVVEEIWDLAAVKFGNLSSWRGRRRFAREKKRWQAVGALESVESARLALNAYREGRDVERLFSKRGEELDEDEERQRAGVMEEPRQAEEEKSKALADGEGGGGTFASANIEEKKLGPPHEIQKLSRAADSRESTLAGTP